MLKVLKNRSEFVNLTKNGDKWVCRSFVVLTTSHNNEDNHPLWGFTASKKIGNAVKRNRAKRRMRAVAAQFLDHEYAGRKKIVLIARDHVLNQPFETMQKDLAWAFRKLKEREKAI